MKITKAVIPAAGLGTRVLPITKAMPKEMYPIIDKPTIQYIVEEAVNSGITDILIITNRGKGLIEEYFDYNIELNQKLQNSQKIELLNELNAIAKLANIYFVRQKEIKGLGHAVLSAKSFVGNEPFAVLYGDDIITSQNEPVCKQLINAYYEYGLGVVGAKEMPKEEIHKYGSLKIEHIKNNHYKCTDMVEKPAPNQIMSLFSILGRCVIPPEIFKILEDTKPGALDEIQLTDAMKVLANTHGMTVVDFFGHRYDIGSKLGIMQAAVEFAIKHNEIGTQFKQYLKDISKNL